MERIKLGNLWYFDKTFEFTIHLRDFLNFNLFVDGEPTVRNLSPELKLGYEKKIPKPRREIVEYPALQKKVEKHVAGETFQISPPFNTQKPRARS